jgi:hypothetical protein
LSLLGLISFFEVGGEGRIGCRGAVAEMLDGFENDGSEEEERDEEI